MEEEFDFSFETDNEDKFRNKILLLKSPYEGRPNTCFFPYPKCCDKVRDTRRVTDPEITN